jgi:hypothetical protein
MFVSWYVTLMVSQLHDISRFTYKELSFYHEATIKIFATVIYLF